MNENHLMSCKDTLEDIAKSTISICREYEKFDIQVGKAADSLEETVNSRFADFNPKIMIYGIYNGGKSTIVNAMIGEVKAKVADIPTTHKIDAYKWKEYTIYDTPGINAPEKDEKVSKEQLNKSDVIIFVMDTEGAFNIGKNYRELVDIARKGKRLLIVLNNKSGYDPSTREGASDIQKITDHIYNDFKGLYDDTTLDELQKRFKIVTVNAQDALQARTDNDLIDEHKDILLQSSQIIRLEEAIIEEYGRANGGFVILKQLEIKLLETMDELLQVLDKIQADPVSEMASQSIIELQETQDGIMAKIVDYAKETANELDEDFYTIMINGKDEDVDVVQEKLFNVSETWSKRVNQFMLSELQKVSRRFDTLITEFTDFAQTGIGDINIPSGVTCTETTSEFFIPDSGNETASIGPAEIMVIDQGLKQALPYIEKLPWVGSVLGKVIGPLAPAIGPILFIASTVLPFFGKSDAEKQQEAEMKRARHIAAEQSRQQEEIARKKQEIKDECGRICRKLISGITEEIRKIIDAAFTGAYQKIQKIIDNQRADSKQAIYTRRKIGLMKTELKTKVAKYCNQ